MGDRSLPALNVADGGEWISGPARFGGAGALPARA
jgi:hypothetical protein